MFAASLRLPSKAEPCQDAYRANDGVEVLVLHDHDDDVVAEIRIGQQYMVASSVQEGMTWA